MHGSHVKFYGFSYVLQTFAVTVLYTGKNVPFENYLAMFKLSNVKEKFNKLI